MHGTNKACFQHVTDPPDSQRNFLVVDSKTETSTIERTFNNFTQERKDIAIVLINQHVRPHLYIYIYILFYFHAFAECRLMDMNPSNNRSRNASETSSILLLTPSLPYWKSQAKTTRTIQRKTVYLSASGDYSGSKARVTRIDNKEDGQRRGTPETNLETQNLLLTAYPGPSCCCVQGLVRKSSRDLDLEDMGGYALRQKWMLHTLMSWTGWDY